MTWPTLDEVRATLQEIFSVQGVPAATTEGGGFVVPVGSAQTYVDLAVEADGTPVIDVWCPLVRDAPPTPALFRHAAGFPGMFGRMVVERTGDDAVQVVYHQTLVGSPISPDVILPILSIVAHTADELDDELIARFGGTRGSG